MKRQGNIVSSLMENFDIADKSLETSLNSSGSAMREHEKWQKSLEAQLLKLKASWQSLSQAFLSSDFLKVAFDGIMNLVDGLTWLIDKVGALPTILGVFAGFKSLSSNVGVFKNFNTDLDGFANKVGIANKTFAELMNSFKSGNTNGGFKGFIDGLKSMGVALANPLSSSDLSAIKSYNQLIDDGVDGQTAFAQTMKDTSVAAQGLVSAANGGKVALTGLENATLGATLKTIGLQAAAIALNVALTMGVSFLVSAGISALTKYINAADELADKVEEVTSKFKDTQRELVKNKSTFEEQAKTYAKLSKGVDLDTGENISLTTAEYEEYLSVTNSIADQVPNLVQGFDSQGNAILNCAGNVDTLTNAYKNLILEQNKEVIDTGDDIFKDLDNKLKKFSKYSPGDLIDPNTRERIKGKDIIGYMGSLDNILKSNDLNKSLESLSHSDAAAISQMLDESDIFERDKWGSGDWGYESHQQFIERAIKEDAENVKKILAESYDEVNKFTEDADVFTEAYLSNKLLQDYPQMTDKMQGILSQVTSGFDASFYSKFFGEADPEAEIRKYMDSLLKAFNDNKVQLESVFDLQNQFNTGDISYGEYIKGLQEAEEMINKLNVSDEIKTQLKLSLNTEEVTDNYEALKTRLTSDEYNIKMKTDEAEEFLDSLSASEYSVAMDLIVNGEVDLSNFDIESLKKYIEEQAKLNDAMNFTIAMDIETESIEALNSAMSESVSGAGLSSEAIASLKGRYGELASEGYNLSAMFEETANGIHLNKKAVSEFEQALASKKLTETQGHLEVLKGEYDNLTKKIDNCTNAGERAALYREQESIVDKINDLATLASQYEGLTSAYQAWQTAESAGNERDMYESIISGWDTVKDELSRGWADDSTVKFLELLTGKTDLAGKSGKELKEVYDTLDNTIKNTGYSIRDFFTVDDEGNATSKGVYNFLDAVSTLEKSEAFKNIEGIDKLVQKDDKGNIIGFDFKVVGGDKAVADALGISEELVQIMVRAADDAGFVVNLEGTFTQLANLKTEAQAAKDELIRLQSEGLGQLKDLDLNFNLEATGDDIVKEHEKAVQLLDRFRKNGKIDLKMEGAQEALDIAEYLTIKLDDLTEPKFMQIDTSEIADENIKNSVEQIQEIGRLCKQKHLVSLTGDTEELNKVQGEIDNVAKEIEDLDPEVKAKVGIDDNWDAATIADKIEKGEIEIPAELKVDVQMSEDLKDMRLMMMKQLGLVSDNEVKLKIGYDIDDSLVDTLDDKEQEVVLTYVEQNKEVWDKLSKDEQEVFVKFVAKGGNLEGLNKEQLEFSAKFIIENEDWLKNYEVKDQEAIVRYFAEDTDVQNYTAPQKQALAKYIADGGDLEGWDAPTKQSFVQYLVDGGDVSNWTPETKEAFAKYIAEHGAVDSWTPEQKEALVKFFKDSTEPDKYQAPPKDQQVTAKLNSSAVDSYNPPPKTMTIAAKIKQVASSVWDKITGGGGVNGTANVEGTAFAEGTVKPHKTKKFGRAFKQGDWGTKDSGVALMGELGRKIFATIHSDMY